MIRKLLATTALVSALTTGAFAQTTADPSADGTAIFNRDINVTISTSDNGYFQAESSDILASNLLGKPIYNGTSDNADQIGDVNDVVMTADGTAKAVVVGVGGFLGMGEKEVAVDFSRVSWADMNGERRLVINTTADELSAAPAFDRSKIGPDQSMAMSNGATTDQSMATKPMTNDQAVVDYTTLSAQDVLGAHVYDGNGDDIGEVSDALMTKDGKTIKAYVVDVGGFLGIGEKPVALAADALQVTKDENANLNVHTSFTKGQLENGPTYSEDAYAKTPDQVLVR